MITIDHYNSIKSRKDRVCSLFGIASGLFLIAILKYIDDYYGDIIQIKYFPVFRENIVNSFGPHLGAIAATAIILIPFIVYFIGSSGFSVGNRIEL